MGINLPQPDRRPLPPMRPKKKKENIGLQSPRLFYTPEEIKYDYPVVHIQFTNTSIAKLYFDELNSQISLKEYALEYERVELRNAKYDYVYVQKGQKELFLEMYMNEKRKDAIQRNKKYI